jgi:hypothetical protein
MSRSVAAIYDIHGNLPALEAVLEDVHRAAVDLVVVGGDVLPGPMPRETMARLLSLDVPGRPSAFARPRIRTPRSSPRATCCSRRQKRRSWRRTRELK